MTSALQRRIMLLIRRFGSQRSVERHHSSSRWLSVTVGKLWAICGHAVRINRGTDTPADSHVIASAHGLTIRFNPWVPALAAIRVVDARGGQAIRSLRLGS